MEGAADKYFEKADLQKYLLSEGLIHASVKEVNVKMFTNGFSNLTYLIEARDSKLVLRHPPRGGTKRGHDMSREYTVMDALSNYGFAAPKVLAYSDGDGVMPYPFYIMEYVEGVIITFKEAKKLNLTNEQFEQLSSTWLDTFIKLHNIDINAAGLQDLGKPQGYVERQVSNWSKQYIKAKTMDVPQATKVMAWLEENKPTEYDFCLIHNDYKYDNVVFEDTSFKNIKAVLDWEMCTLGDPLMDLGSSLAYWTMASDDDFLKQGIPSPTIFDGNPSRDEIIHQYGLKSGRDVRNFKFYYVFGLFKVAVIAQQIYYRYTKGLTQNPKFAQLDKAAAYLCVKAETYLNSKL